MGIPDGVSSSEQRIARRQPPEHTATEVKRLQLCMNDLIRVLALPAVWSDSDPSGILDTFLDALLAMLDLDSLHAQALLDSHEALIDALGTTRLYGTSHSRNEIRQALNRWFGEDSQQSPADSLVLGDAAIQAANESRQRRGLKERQQVASELDRRVAERTRELAESNAELQLQVGLLQHLPVSAWTLKPDGTPDFVNDVWLEYSGQTLEFVRSHPEAWMTAVHPEDRERASRAYRDGVRSGRGFAIETRSLRAQDRTYRWHLQQAVALRDAEGKVFKFVGTTTDIDDQKRADEELRAREANLRQIVDSIPGLVCTMDATGEIQQLNRPLLEYFGKTPEELRGWKMTDAVHPDDYPEVIKAYTHSVTTGTPYEIEHRCRRADGVYRWFQVRGLAVRDPEGRRTGWYVLLTDIDDRKRAEEELQRKEAFLADGQRLSLTGSFSWRLDTDEVVFSEEACRIFEFPPDAPLTLEQVRGRVHPDDVALLSEKTSAARNTSENQDYEIRLRMPDGRIKHLHAVSHATRRQDGRWEYMGALQDVTGQRLAEDALSKLRSELAHVARVTSLGALTASIAHEVNQPIAGIMTNATTCLRMLTADPPNIDGARETARRMIRDSNRASEVITRLRTLFSRKETTIEPVDISEATREIIALSLSELQRDRVIVQQELQDDLPPVAGDRVQLQQVILNLLRNASEALSGVDDRPRELIVRTERDEGDCVRLTVRDTGVGIAPHDMDRLFDAFYTTKSGGMGMGLSVSRSIIDSHHGRLWAAPNDGPGTNFSFSLPCIPEGMADRGSLDSTGVPGETDAMKLMRT
jgi:PAS domain S-box-containing protein